MRVFIKVMYDGSNYCGWQLQPNKPTIQGQLQDAIKKVTGQSVNIVGSGRTDAGVHALGQVAHFDLNTAFEIKKLPLAINFYLNKDIRVVGCKKVSNNFHARYSCKQKTYIYKMYISDYDNPLLLNRQLRIPSIDFERVRQATSIFVGTHDFSSFMSSNSEVKSTIRTVYLCNLTKSSSFLTLSITANGFLYNMVRKITASLLALSQNKLSLDFLMAQLKTPTKQITQTAPPQALYLKSVKYT